MLSAPRPGLLSSVASRVSATLVALIAGYSSYLHIAHVALRYGERPEIAYALPFAIDGLLIVATTAMLDDTRHHRHIRWSARLAFTFGVTASLAANIASAMPTLGARVVAAIPAIALLLAVEVVSRTGRPRTTGSAAPAGLTGGAGVTGAARNGHTPAPSTPSANLTDPPSADPTAVAERPPMPPATAVAATTATAAGSRVAAAAIEEQPLNPTSRTADTAPAIRSTATAAGRPVVPWSTAAKVAALLTAEPRLDTAAVAARLGISPRSARRHLANHKPQLLDGR